MADETSSCTPQQCEFQDNLERLRTVGFFSGIPMEPLKVLAYLAKRESYAEGETLFEQDEVDAQAFVLLTGAAQSSMQLSGDGSASGPTVTVAEYEEGDFIGGLSLLGDMRRLFTLTATRPTTCLVLTREQFMRTMEQFPQALPRVLASVVDDVRSWERALLAEHASEFTACRAQLGVTLI